MPSTTGQVKWFNTKTGFGFITGLTGDHKDSDIFVHHSDLSVDEEQYRYLVMGEYVEFEVMDTEDEHKIKAHKVTGVLGGKLMCEIKNAVMKERRERGVPPPTPRGRGRGRGRPSSRPESDSAPQGEEI